MYKKITITLSLLYCSVLLSQEVKEQIELKIDNDKFLSIDRYYTSGIFISYKKTLENNFIFKNEVDTKVQLNFALGNETYTPFNLSSTNVQNFDRPFAGWFFGELEVGKIKAKSASFLTFKTGITGRESFSGRLQVWVHDFLGVENFSSWTEEIAFKWLFNLKYRHIQEWSLNKRNLLQYQIQPTLGSKDIFLENNISYFFGKMNNFNNSSRIGVIDNTNTNEYFGFLSLGYKYVAHNALIEGSLFREDVLFTTDASKHIFKFNIGGTYKVNKNTFKLIYNFNSKETPSSISHSFGTFSYSIDF